MTSFDDRASTWDDDPAKVERARAVAAAIRARLLLSPSLRVLEYGAGTGLVSQALAEDVGPLTLSDPSAGMRHVMESKVACGALPAGSRVCDIDLSNAEVPAQRFDLIMAVMTLHHIPVLEPVLAGFVDLLEPGGHLCVVDLVEEDGSFHEGGDFDGHNGFDTAELAKLLRAAGLAESEFAQVYEVEKREKSYPLFLATCRKPG